MIDNAVQTRYDLYRMLPKDLFLERMVVTFMDDSAFVKSNHISVRVVLTHIETKENFGHIVELDEIPKIYNICQNSWPD